jgi:hypothetical protein
MNDRDLSKLYAKWIDEAVQPNVYIVATLKQAVPTGLGGLHHGNTEIYDGVATKYLKALSRRV